MGDNNKIMISHDDALLDSGDEAFLQMLGLTTSVVKGLQDVGDDDEVVDDDRACETTLDRLMAMTDSSLEDIIVNNNTKENEHHNLVEIYDKDRVVRFPEALCLPASFMRRITEEVVWSSSNSSTGGGVATAKTTTVYYPSDKTYETIRVIRKRPRSSQEEEERKRQEKQKERGEESNHLEQQSHPSNEEERPEEEEGGGEDDGCDVVYYEEQRRCLTRLEDFCRHHPEWTRLCNYIGRILSLTCGTEMVLYKEKLNLKPGFGGSGFAPHLDTPSLLVAAKQQFTAAQQDNDTNDHTDETDTVAGPTSFVTVMVAIDDMTDKNGCLRVVKGPWSKDNAVATIIPEKNGNPDADGRAGAIPPEIADTLDFESICCKGGTIVAFDGWVPHRSAANTSPFGRRAVFLTYNPKSQGDFHDTYYRRMHNLRNQWRTKIGLATNDEQMELEALSTIPGI